MLGVDAAAKAYHGGTPAAWALITPVREPVSHYVSWFHYFAEPDTHFSVEQWVNTGRSANGVPLRRLLLRVSRR